MFATPGGKIRDHGVTVLDRGRVRVVGCKPIVDADHDRTDVLGDSPVDAVAAVEAALHEGATVQVDRTGAGIKRCRRTIDAIRLVAGESVLVTGASGGAGSALVQLARARDAEVVAVTSRRWADRVQELEPLGVVLRDEGDLADQARSSLGRDAFDVVADVVAGEHFSDYLALLRAGGRYISAGAMAGAVVPFDICTLYLKRLTLMGVSVGHRHHFEAVLDHIRAGRIRPLLAESFPMSAIHEAQTVFMSKEFFGNIVVRPKD